MACFKDFGKIKIVSENQASSLDLAVIATGNEIYPSMMLSVSIMDEEFTGAYDKVWVSAEDLAKFVADLLLCEQVRKGQASLSSLSPDDLKLTVEQSDGWGHFVLRYTLGRISYSSRISLSKSLSGGFDLDSGSFKEIVEDFADLLRTIAPP